MSTENETGEELLAAWATISENSRDEMTWLGNFGPTFKGEIKGYMRDQDGDNCKTYLEPSDLRGLAAACIEVAEWLERRAKS